MGKVRISLSNVNKSYYADTSVTQALRGVSLSFEMGEFVTITGESGSGKSTLLNIIAGLENIDEGEMFIDGAPTSRYDDSDWEAYRRNSISYVFQDYGIIGHYSTIDNIISALLPLGVSFEEAKQRAVKYLEKVGLAGFEKSKASELSSGQKQRLSIARALSKDTGIILLDEPTGNLDSETGEQIVVLLKELSRECLIIMITHNYAQAEPYATRKIQIHDGMVVSDIKANERETEPTDRKVIEQKKTQEHKLSWYFALLNIRTQKARAVFLTVFLLIMNALSYLLIGQIGTQRDDIFTRQYQKKAFAREDDTRLVIKKSDGSDLNLEDLERIKALKYVRTADICDVCNDINFYFDEKKDYEYIYGWAFRGAKTVTVNFLNEDRFMMSDSAISEADLKWGSLPQSRDEIVIYSNAEKMIGKTVTVYFRAKNIWDNTEYYKARLKIVGILKEETEQVYFSKELCMMLASSIDIGELRLCYDYDLVMQDYKKKYLYVPLFDTALHGSDVYLGEKAEVKLYGTNPFVYIADGTTTEMNLKVSRLTHESSGKFIMLSEEKFYELYEPRYKQASVYLEHYSKTDQLIGKLEKMGYSAVSTQRIGAGDYVDSRVNERMITILICAGGLLLTALAKILILYSLLKLRLKDQIVLKNIGMKLSLIKRISYREVLVYELVAIAFTILGINTVGGRIPMIREMIWYYTPAMYVMFCAFALVLSAICVKLYNNLLKRRLN